MNGRGLAYAVEYRVVSVCRSSGMEQHKVKTLFVRHCLPRILYGKDGCGTDIPLIWVGKQAIKKETGKWYKRMTGNSFGIVLKREWAYSLVNRKAGGANLYGSLPPTLHIHIC